MICMCVLPCWIPFSVIWPLRKYTWINKKTNGVQFLTHVIEKYCSAATDSASSQPADYDEPIKPAWKKAKQKMLAKHGGVQSSNDRKLRQYRCISTMPTDDVLSWWKKQTKTIPKLTLLAKGVRLWTAHRKHSYKLGYSYYLSSPWASIVMLVGSLCIESVNRGKLKTHVYKMHARYASSSFFDNDHHLHCSLRQQWTVFRRHYTHCEYMQSAVDELSRNSDTNN